MTYATRDDLESRYGADELTQRESMLGVDSVNDALSAVDAVVDGYVAKRYVVPLTPVPGLVVTLAAKLARYDILGDAATERARLDYEDAMRALRDIQAGRVDLDAVTPTVGATTSSAPQFVQGESVFNAPGVGF